MRVLADGRVRRTATEWREILARYEASGLRASEFCKREGIARSVLAYWRRRLQGKGEEPAGQFVEVPSGERSGGAPLTPGEMELLLPGGVTLRWRP